MSQGIEKSGNLILPKFITIADNSGTYLGLSFKSFSGMAEPWDSLMFAQKEPAAICTFEVISHPSGRIMLKGSNGKFVNQAGSSANDTYFHCAGDKDAVWFDIVRLKGSQIYLHAATTFPAFITNRSRTIFEGGGVAGSTYVGTECLLTISEPILSKEIVSIEYNLQKPVLWDVPPLIALNTTVRNDSRTSDLQQTLAYSYQRSKVGTWSNTAGIEIGTEMSFSAKVPLISSADFKISLSASYSHTWGTTEGTEETVTSSTQITVPPGKKGMVTVLVKRKGMDVKFKCQEKVMYKDGSTKVLDKEGVYHNIESYAVDVQAGDWENA